MADFVIGSGVCGFVKCSVSGVLFSHAFSGELKAVGIVNEAVEDGVAQCGVADDGVPLIDRNLTGDDGGRATVAVIEDLQKVASLGRVEHRQAPIVEHEELHAADGFEQASIAAVAAGERERLKQTRHAMVLD